MTTDIPEISIVVTRNLLIDKSRTGALDCVPGDLPEGSVRFSGTVDEIEDQIENVIHFSGVRPGSRLAESQAETVRMFLRGE